MARGDVEDGAGVYGCVLFLLSDLSSAPGIRVRGERGREGERQRERGREREV